MQELLRDYLQQYGYLVLFVGTFLEGETVVILAGFLAFQGYLNIYGVVLAALAGSFLGDQCYFHVGRWKGAALFRIFAALSRKFRRALRMIERYGNFIAFISRYTYGFRILLPLILGMTAFPSNRFLLLNLVSALSWALLFALVGFFFGQVASFFLDDPERFEPYLLLILASLVALAWGVHYLVHSLRRKRRYRSLMLQRENRRKARLAG